MKKYQSKNARLRAKRAHEKKEIRRNCKTADSYKARKDGIAGRVARKQAIAMKRAKERREKK